jgi:hypothetical protein
VVFEPLRQIKRLLGGMRENASCGNVGVRVVIMIRIGEYRRNKTAVGVVLAIVCAGLFGGAAALASSGHGTPASGVKAASFADRFAAARPDCSGGGWPYLAPQCLRRPDGTGLHPVRVIAVDRQTPVR